MTIDEAIKHAEEVAEEHTKYNRYGGFESCDKCGEEHRQLAKWLKELKDYREAWHKIKEQIREESDFAYADFDKYKCEVLGVDVDELPDDDFRYGLQRAFDIINEHIRPQVESEDKDDTD